MKPPPLSCVHAVKQKASLAKSGLTSLATAAGGMYCVSTCECARVPVCLRLCVRVFVSVKMRWPDCSAEQWGKTQPRVVRIAPIKTHKRRTTMHPCCQPPPPLSESLRVWCACHASPPSHAYTHTGTPDHAKADLKMKNDPPLAVHGFISSQL